jgi:similar to spore coat protein
MADLPRANYIGKEVISLAQQGLAVHETLEMHEMLIMHNVCLTKAKTMQPLVSDNELKNLMMQDVQKTTQHIQELSSLLSRAETTTI